MMATKSVVVVTVVPNEVGDPFGIVVGMSCWNSGPESDKTHRKK